ncbi:MAG: hypothetical protein IJW40_01695 [Clostridia bacterium]|nr:hypothetical protein [Clostridia bacterium]
MKKSRIWAGMLALLLMLTGCGTEEGKYDVFREAVAQTPERELPKSTIMQSAPPPEYVITDAVEQYEKEEHFPISATNESAQGELVVKYNLYRYMDGNVAIVSVENRSAFPLSLRLVGRCCDDTLQPVYTEEKQFDGFAAGWQNYFVFYSGAAFEHFTYEISFTPYEGECYGQYIQNVTYEGMYVTKAKYDHITHELITGDWMVSLAAVWRYDYLLPTSLPFSADFVLFDGQDPDRIYMLDTRLLHGEMEPIDRTAPAQYQYNQFVRIAYTDHDTPYAKVAGITGNYTAVRETSYTLPQELEGVWGIVAIKSLGEKG